MMKRCQHYRSQALILYGHETISDSTLAMKDSEGKGNLAAARCVQNNK